MYYYDDDLLREFVLTHIKNKTTTSNEYEEGMKLLLSDAEAKQCIKGREYINQFTEDILYCGLPVQTERQRTYIFLNLIANLNSNKQKGDKKFYSNLVRRAGIIKKIKKIKNGFILTNSSDREIIVLDIARNVPGFLNQVPELSDFAKRQRKCHYNSMRLSQGFQCPNTEVVTGWIDITFEGKACLHSWVERSSEDGRTIVYDSNFNSIFRKEDYYDIRGAVPLTRVSQAEIKKIFEEKMLEKGGRLEGVNPKELLLYFNEIMQILEAEKTNENASQMQ